MGWIGELAWLAGELALGPGHRGDVRPVRGAARRLPDELVLGPVRAELTRGLRPPRYRGAGVGARGPDSDALPGCSRARSTSCSPILPFTRRAAREAPRGGAAAGGGAAYRRMAAAMVTAGAAPADPSGTRRRMRPVRRPNAPALRHRGGGAGHRTPGARRLQRRLEAVQDLLGAHQDTAVTRATPARAGLAVRRPRAATGSPTA